MGVLDLPIIGNLARVKLPIISIIRMALTGNFGPVVLRKSTSLLALLSLLYENLEHQMFSIDRESGEASIGVLPRDI
jgi:hypothetical protein